ncbi:hypothetical protein ACWATR_14840 [Nostoc sp. UIC 10890]
MNYQERQRAEENTASSPLPVTEPNLGLKPRRKQKRKQHWAGSESPSNCSFCPLPPTFFNILSFAIAPMIYD